MPSPLRLSTFAAIVATLLVVAGCNSGNDRYSDRSARSSSDDSSSDSSSTAQSTNDGGGSKPAGDSTPVAAGAAAEGGWGSLVMTFHYDGEAPTRPAVNVNQNPDVCGVHDLRDETLVINPENKGIRSIFVYMSAEAGDDLPIHESYEATAEEPVVIDNKNCRFAPHGMLARTGQPVLLVNSDSVGHNIKANPRANNGFNLNLQANSQTEVKAFTESERRPFPVECNIHTWMNGWVLVKDHPYMAISDENGELRIENLPAGTWEFLIWQEKLGFVSDVTLNGEETEWVRGRVNITIEPDSETEMQVTIAPEAFGN